MNWNAKLMIRCLVCSLAIAVLAACGEAPTDTGGAEEETISKERAANLGGKQDGLDLCEALGWYGDGVCDTFCPNPDPDCSSSYDPCGGKTCGDNCTLCEPNDPDCIETAVVKVCQADGSCSAGQPKCSTDPDPDPDPGYDPCGEKACGETCTICPPNDPDCVETAVVKVCQADGSCSAAQPQCSTDPDPDPDPGYDPCGGKACGDSCTICDPNDPDCTETAVVKFCQSDGTCAATQPQCTSPECQSDSDCIVTGCSSHVCAPEPIETTCEWRDEYACYQQYGDCGCNNGTCGWADTADLNSCLSGN